jgi:hypothetical protein
MIVVSMVLFTQTIQAAVTDDFTTTGNIFAYNSPYSLTYSYTDGPNSDMFSISITANVSAIDYITIRGLTSLTMLDAINYTSGSGFYSSIHNHNDSSTLQLSSQYDTWYNIMVFDVTGVTLTTGIKFYFHYTLSGGITTDQWLQAFKNNVSIVFANNINLQELIEIARQEGYTQGLIDGEEIAYIDGYTDGLSDGYTDGLSDGYEGGYDDGLYDYHTGIYGTLDPTLGSSYQQGRTDYQQSSDNDVSILIDFLPGILGVFVGFFFQLASISALGISILDLLAAMFGIAVALALFKLFFGR